MRDITKGDLQRFVAKISKGKTTPSTVRNTLLPVRVIFRDAVDHDVMDANPTIGLKLPADRARRENIASRDDAKGLIAAAPEADRAVWAPALYAGLRLGELRALRWQDVDFSKGVIRVRRSWDPKERCGGSRAGPPA